MNELKMPDAFTSVRPDAYETVTEEIVSKPMAAIHVACWRGQWKVDVSEFLIGAEVAPGVDRTGVLPRSAFPSLDTELAILRNRSESPPDFARLHVVGTYVASSSFLDVRVVCDRGAYDNNVSDDERRRREVERLRLLCKSGAKVDLTAVSKTLNQLAGFGMDGKEVRRTNRENPFVIAGPPVCNPASRGAVQPFFAQCGRLLYPKSLAGRRIESLNQANAVGSVKHTVDHQRRGAE